ncbi:hypothetical protein YTXLTZUM_CDS0111 [Enterococcus phage VRE9_3]
MRRWFESNLKNMRIRYPFTLYMMMQCRFESYYLS